MLVFIKYNKYTGLFRFYNATTCQMYPNLFSKISIFFLSSGSTGKPKGVLHTTGGYLLYAATTFKYVFDYHPGDIYWCTADVGWITGHSYVVYGPLANGATSVIVSFMKQFGKI